MIKNVPNLGAEVFKAVAGFSYCPGPGTDLKCLSVESPLPFESLPKLFPFSLKDMPSLIL